MRIEVPAKVIFDALAKVNFLDVKTIELDIPDPAPAAPRVRTCMELARYAAGIVEGAVNCGHAQHIAAARARDLEAVLRERLQHEGWGSQRAMALIEAADICAQAAAKDEGES